MGLTASEKKMMERLSRKAEEPDAAPVSKSINVLVDLKDAASVAMAKKFGFLSDDEENEGDEEEENVEEPPRRRGYFGD